MSLINEALKKAQRQRSLESAPLSSAPSGIAAAAVTTHIRSASHKRSHAPIWFGLGVLALGVGATFLVMRYGFDQPIATPPGQAKPVAAIPSASPHPAPAAPVAKPAAATTQSTQVEPAQPAPMVVLPPIPSVAPSTAPVAAVQPPAAPSAPASALTPTAPSPVAAPAANVPAPAPVVPTPVALVPVELTPAEREAKIYSFINNLRLAGVRGLDREARVLMNERVWRLNDIVSPDLGLRLSAVRPNLLVFTDAQGKTYEKPY